MTLYALAISSNQNREHWTRYAMQQLEGLGECQFSGIYQIPCRQGKGADYYNLAVLLQTHLNFAQLDAFLKQLEVQAGRIRPSHHIPLDMDIVAYGAMISSLQPVASRLPLPFDAVKPLSELWQDCPAADTSMPYQIVNQ